MPKYSVSYANTNILFEIRNVEKHKNDNISNNKSILNVVKNILLRSHTVKPSETIDNYFIEKYGKKLNHFEYNGKNNYIEALSSVNPKWTNTIKGGEGGNPALELFNSIQKILEDNNVKFLINTILPEANIQDFVIDEQNILKDSRTDFYIDWYQMKTKNNKILGDKMCIEVDGSQHATDEQQKTYDEQRDRLINSECGRAYVKRITPKEIDDFSQKFTHELIKTYKESTKNNKRFRFAEDENNIEYIIRSEYDIILRIQLLLLELLINDVIDINAPAFELNIINTDNLENLKELINIAIDDLYEYIINISCLCEAGINDTPDAIVRFVTENNIYNNNILIDFRYKGKIDENIDSRTILVATDYYNYYNYRVKRSEITKNVFEWRMAGIDERIDEGHWYYYKNYFEISTSKRIQYTDIYIDHDGRKYTALKFFLKTIFNYDDFRSGQLGIINHLLQNNRTIGILPTGSGKSVCYILCAMLQPGVSFVICPIVSLIIDQLHNVKEFGIDNVNAVTSENNSIERTKILDDFANGKNQIFWCSPERFQIQEFRDSLIALNDVFNFGYGIIDEVHCMSEWGHEFRTSYLHLVKAIDNCCSDIVIGGLTATAMPSTVKDLMAEFEVDNTAIKTLNRMDRDELHFEIIKAPKDEKFEALKSILYRMNDKYRVFEQNENGDYDSAGIIFTLTTSNKTKYPGCMAVRAAVNQIYDGKCDDYYSSKKDKNKTQRSFIENKISLLAATKAFGMGVNKKNIRFTVHFNTPGSLESFYQEAGRAGRDHEEADCFVIDSNSYSQHTIEGITKYFNAIEENLDNISSDEVKSNLDETDMNTVAYFKQANYASIEKSTISAAALLFEEIIPKLSDSCRNAVIYKKNSIDDNEKEKSDAEDKEKLLYRLSILGLVDDWTIDYSKNTMVADCITLRNRCIKDGAIVNLEELNDLLDKSLQKYFARQGIKRKVFVPITQETTAHSLISSYLRVLYKWAADNITRARVIASRDIFEEFKNFKSSDELVEHINLRFRLDVGLDADLSALMQKSGKDAYDDVFSLIRDNSGRLKELYAQTQRYRTSYDIDAINFMYAILHAIFNNVDEELLDIVFRKIKDDNLRHYVIMESIELFSNDDIYEEITNAEDIKEEIGLYFANRNSDIRYIIYGKMQDNGSACEIVKENIMECVSILSEIFG